jgi:hypothetical protein
MVTMLTPNGLPSDGKIEVVFPEGFNVRGLTVAKSVNHMLTADGGVLIVDQVPEFVNLVASTNSRIANDLSRISVSFAMNFDPENGTKIILGNLGLAQTPSTSNLHAGGPDRALFGPAVWVQGDGEISINVTAAIPANRTVHLWFDLQNPGSINTGVRPRIRSEPAPCGFFECESMPAAEAEFGGDRVLVVNDSPMALTRSIESGNPVAGELVTIKVNLKFNFALHVGQMVTISGLNETSTSSALNLSVTGPAAACSVEAKSR